MSPDIPQHDKSKYYEKMSGKETTDEWDILVSYTEKQLNDLLAKIWGSKKLFSHVVFKHNYGSKTHPFIKGFDVTLGSPVLYFGELDGHPRAYLKMPVSGTLTYPDSTSAEGDIIPHDTYQLSIAVPLSSFSASDDEFHSGKDVINFNEGINSEHFIVFHFANKNATWDFGLIDKSKPGPLLEDLEEAKRELVDWFSSKSHVTWIDYSLSKISNKKDPTSVLLRPKSYKFVTMKGVLNVFIETQGGGHGPGNPQNTQFGRRYADFNFSPIPAGFTGCIIISKRLFLVKYLMGQIQSSLSGHLQKDGGLVEKTTSAGAKLELRYKHQVAIHGGSYSGGSVSFEIESLTVDFNDHPVTLEFFDESPYENPKFKWVWTFDGSTDYWTLSRGSAKTHATLHSEIKKTTKILATVDGYKLDFNLSFGNNNQPETKVTNVNVDPMKPSVTFPTFKIDLPELNFFSTQNVFAPGENFIQVSNIMFPADLVLAGQTSK